MRKEILFKKGIITALTVAMVTSLAPAIGAGGLKTITAKAKKQNRTTIIHRVFVQNVMLTSRRCSLQTSMILTMIIARTMCTRLEMQVSFSGLQDL